MTQMSVKVKLGEKINNFAWKLGAISYSNNITRTAYNISASLIGKAVVLVNKEYKIGNIRKEVEAKWVALGIKKITPSLTYESGKPGEFMQRFVWQSITSPFKNMLNSARGITMLLNERKQAKLLKDNEDLALSIQRSLQEKDLDEHDPV
jgi:hypothetical protein